MRLPHSRATSRLSRAWFSLALAAGLLFLSGCADIRQEIHVNHDGAGKIVETVSVTPRGLRLLQGMHKDGGAGASPALLSDAALQERLKALGEVTLAGKKETELEDGRRQLEVTYTFQNLGKVNLWIVPTFSYNDSTGGRDARKIERTGKLNLKWAKGPYERFGRIYRETIGVDHHSSHFFPLLKVASPAERRQFERVLPVFLDMLSDFRLSIVLVAPIESFEEPDMVEGLPVDHNRVTLFQMTGQGLAQAPQAVLHALMNEMPGGGAGNRVAGSVPDLFTPWIARHGGYSVRFMKLEDAKK